MRPDFKDFRGLGLSALFHSAKGSTWEDHKYIKRLDGTYYYPDSYEGGRHLPSGSEEKKEKTEDWEKKVYDGLKKSSNALDDAKYNFGDLLAKYSGLDLSKLSKEEVDRMQKKIVGNLSGSKDSERLDLDKNDIEKLANEVVKGNFGVGQTRKDLLGANYQEIQNRVNEIMRSKSGSKKVSEVSKEKTDTGAKEAEKVVKSSTGGLDLETVYSVYRKQK